MSTGLAHFAVGAAFTTFVVTLLLPACRHPRLLVVGGGVWGVLPDAWRITPVYRSQLEALHFSPWADLFWFHYTMDRLDPHDSNYVAAASIVLFLGITMVAEWREYRGVGVGLRRRRARIRDHGGSDIEE